ncbi:hypothetical protein [[Mycoplasma] collis]|nr:hypothetical protein [[Mycoplasma] collis]
MMNLAKNPISTGAKNKNKFSLSKTSKSNELYIWFSLILKINATLYNKKQ